KVDGCRITGLANRDRFPVPGHLRDRDDPISCHLRSTRFKHIKVQTSGRSPAEAALKALEKVGFLRGLWNFFATPGHFRYTLGSQCKPIARITTGPLHMIHGTDGSPVGDSWWYQPHYTEDSDLFEPSGGWASMEKAYKWAMRKMRRLPYRA